MAIRLRENQYKGINAHLHSYFQRRGGWPGFHGQHITDLVRFLQTVLPLESGYVADSERSLQIAYYDPVVAEQAASLHRPDISIYRGERAVEGTLPPSSGAAAPTAIFPIETTMIASDEVPSVLIYKLGEGEGLGRLVTRVELLSPANKPGGSNFPDYFTKRNETLNSGVNLVELDYLHERRSHIAVLADYTRREPGSHPYHILVSDPSAGRRHAQEFSFRVDDSIPPISIPLDGDDAVTLDFGAAYQYTFAANNIYSLVIVDYEVLPEAFDTYDESDHQRIRAVMARAAEVQGQA